MFDIFWKGNSGSSPSTDIRVNGQWKPVTQHVEGEKIEAVRGKMNCCAFCRCGNELVHSRSFLGERDLGKWSVYDYKCTHCGESSHWNPDIIPGLLPCAEDGTPLN
jgi:hypothetical protein